MNSQISLSTALCLPKIDVAALIQGRMIAALVNNFLPGAKQIALCPISPSSNSSQDEQNYHPGLPRSLESWQPLPDNQKLVIGAWATLEACRIYTQKEELEAISRLTIWSENMLRDVVYRRHKIFVAFLRVYQLPQPVEIPLSRVSSDKIGKVIRLKKSAYGNTSLPILDDSTFQRRRKQLENLLEPEHIVLEKLQNQLIQSSDLSLGGRSLSDDIQTFLGWQSPRTTAPIDSDLAWIQQISKIGNSSDGHEFEKLVRRSLLKLGFSNSETNPKASLNPESTGGAGGIDIYCEKPFRLVGECKASETQKIPTEVCSQLTYLGQAHLTHEDYHASVKVIFAAINLTNAAENIAVTSHMNVIQPETLQRLTELKSKHPGSINLFQLKECLENDPFGINADRKVNDFIDQILEGLKVRSLVTDHVKRYQSRSNLPDCEAGNLYATFTFEYPNCLSQEDFEAILSELSSPLVGCLGRRREQGWMSDRFYYLRDLIIE
jgi:hypothetical protein